MPIILTRGLTKTFQVLRRRDGSFSALRSFFHPLREEKSVVRDVSLSVRRGELVALLGPNGAGKSTTIKMLAGILTPTSGEVLVNGRVPHRNRSANARSVGAVFGQKTQLWWDLPARHSFRLLQDIFSVPESIFRRQLADFDEILELSSFWETPVRSLSLGQRVRCEMAAAMLHDPAVVFLDEPTIGMDAVAKERSREFLRSQVRDRGRTVVLTTHDMGEVARLSERILLINHGRLEFDGALSALREKVADRPRVNVAFANPVARLEVMGATVESNDGTHATLVPEYGVNVETVVQSLTARFAVVRLAVEERDIEDILRDAYLAGFARLPATSERNLSV